MPSLLKRKRERTGKAVHSAATTTTTNFYHCLVADYDSTLARIAAPSTPQSASPAPCHFMRLPAELRLQIYAHVLHSKNPIIVHRPFDITQLPHLLMASKTVRHEALPLYYLLNTFSISLYMDEFPTAARWLARRIDDTGGKPMRNVRFTIWGIEWESVPALIPLLEMIWNRSVVLDFGMLDESCIVDGRMHEEGPFLAAKQNGVGHLQCGMLTAAIFAQRLGIEGGSMVDVVDATAAAFGHAASLTNDRPFYVVMREYGLYHNLARLRAGYAELSNGSAVPGKSCAKTCRQLCRRRERRSMCQQLVRSSGRKGKGPSEHDREQCAEIYQVLCRGSGRRAAEEGRISTRG